MYHLLIASPGTKRPDTAAAGALVRRMFAQHTISLAVGNDLLEFIAAVDGADRPGQRFSFPSGHEGETLTASAWLLVDDEGVGDEDLPDLDRLRPALDTVLAALGVTLISTGSRWL